MQKRVATAPGSHKDARTPDTILSHSGPFSTGKLLLLQEKTKVTGGALFLCYRDCKRNQWQL